MTESSCTLATLVSPPDLPFMAEMIRHRHRALNTGFKERLLVLDTGPRPRQQTGRTDFGSLDELRAACERLIDEGLIDRLIEADHRPAQRAIYQRHFAGRVRDPRDHRGIPSIALILAIEQATTDHVLYFDCDIFLSQRPGHNWVEEGIALLAQQPDVMFVSPLSGPPAGDRLLQQRGVPYEHDPRGFYRLKTFTARKWLVDRRRLAEMLPLRPTYVSWKRRALGMLTGASALIPWEVAISQKLEQTKFWRADLDSPSAWTLHAPDHGPEFLRSLPHIAARIEAGWFPPEQAGDYDLRLPLWLADAGHPVEAR